MKKTAIYPGSFDPITNGHVDIILRSGKMFDEVVVAVAKSDRKNTGFVFEKRLAMVKKTFAEHAHILVVPLEGLLVDAAKACNAGFIVRGLRNAQDFDYEYQQVEMNHCLAPEIETVFISASKQNRFISSTMVREIRQVGGDVSSFVPSEIQEDL